MRRPRPSCAPWPTHLKRGAAFLIDYGFGESEYYHPQRHMGTVMCHRAHRADTNPLADVGLKDITAHVNFTGVALAGQDAGLNVLGYTSQARFLLNCGPGHGDGGRQHTGARERPEADRRARDGRAVQGDRRCRRRAVWKRWGSPRATAAIRDHGLAMIRWLIVIFLALMLISWFTPLLQKLGVGKLPGDFRFRLFGREWFIPLTTTVMLSMVAALIARFV